MASPREVAESYYAALERNDIDAALAFFGDDGELVSPSGPMRGPDQIGRFLTGFGTAFPDARFNLGVTVEVGNTVAEEGTYSGTHTGPLMTPDGQEIPPTGKTVHAPFAAFSEVVDGKIVSQRVYWDQLGFMAQLGLM